MLQKTLRVRGLLIGALVGGLVILLRIASPAGTDPESARGSGAAGRVRDEASLTTIKRSSNDRVSATTGFGDRDELTVDKENHVHVSKFAGPPAPMPAIAAVVVERYARGDFDVAFEEVGRISDLTVRYAALAGLVGRILTVQPHADIVAEKPLYVEIDRRIRLAREVRDAKGAGAPVPQWSGPPEDAVARAKYLPLNEQQLNDAIATLERDLEGASERDKRVVVRCADHLARAGAVAATLAGGPEKAEIFSVIAYNQLGLNDSASSSETFAKAIVAGAERDSAERLRAARYLDLYFTRARPKSGKFSLRSSRTGADCAAGQSAQASAHRLNRPRGATLPAP
jgi:hypothetical protein